MINNEDRMPQEMLIHANEVSCSATLSRYEFIINEHLEIVECLNANPIKPCAPIARFEHVLNEVLFELNHVRVNPKINNDRVITAFKTALLEIGVKVNHPPENDELRICFKPFGEISRPVRFYFRENKQMILLAPAKGLKLLRSQGT